jgi:hypothetical protein
MDTWQETVANVVAEGMKGYYENLEKLEKLLTEAMEQHDKNFPGTCFRLQLGDTVYWNHIGPIVTFVFDGVSKCAKCGWVA